MAGSSPTAPTAGPIAPSPPKPPLQPMRDRLVLATRGSALALAQANHVADALRAAWPGLAVDLTIIRTIGDAVTELSLIPI